MIPIALDPLAVAPANVTRFPSSSSGRAVRKRALANSIPRLSIHFGSLLTGNTFSICGGAALWARGGAFGPDSCFT
jgi:hypothetical protein